MSNNLRIDIAPKITINMTSAEINEKLKEIENIIDSKIIFKIDPKALNAVKDFGEAMNSLRESRKELENTINKVFPTLDSKKFIELFVYAPLRTGSIDMSFYHSLFEVLRSYSNEDVNIVVNTPTEKKTSIVSFEDFKMIIFTLIISITSNFHNHYLDNDSIEKQDLIRTEFQIEERIQLNDSILLNEMETYEMEHHSDLERIEKKLIEIINNQEKVLTERNQSNEE